MILWKRSLNGYINIHPVQSTAFLPLIYCPPNSPVSVHIAIYLPTSGRENDFLDQITQLSSCIDELKELYPSCIIFIRGDGNVNKINLERYRIFSHFLATQNLLQIPVNHKTYHHFLGGGLFDSEIDVILQTNNSPQLESVTNVFCSLS